MKRMMSTAAVAYGAIAVSATGLAADDTFWPSPTRPGTAETKTVSYSGTSYPSYYAYDAGHYLDNQNVSGLIEASSPEDFETEEFEASITPGQINAQAAYAEGVFGKGVKVGVIDEDFDINHPDLDPNIVGFEDITAGNRLGQADPDNEEIAGALQALDDLIEANVEGGHGTQVTGVIAAARNNEGTQGVAPNVSILAIRADTHIIDDIEDEDAFDASEAVDYLINPADADDASQTTVINILDDEGEIDQDKALAVLQAIEDEDLDVVGVQRGGFDDENTAEGVDIAVDQGADIVNLSLGSAEEGFDETATNAIIRATDSGRIVVISNGNEDRTDEEDSPLATPPDSDLTAQIAADPRTNGLVLAVGVVDEDNEIRFNNCGSSKDRCLVAPGVNIETTENGGGTTTVDGSSFSAPAVSGSLALLLERFPTISPEDAVNILLASATDLGETGVDDVFGHGLVNIERAVQPIGVASLPIGNDIRGGITKLSSSTLGLSGAFGDAFSNVASLQNGVFLDGFRRPFKANLQGNVSAAKRGIDFESVLSGSDLDTKSFNSGGFNVTLALRDDVIDDFDGTGNGFGAAQTAYQLEQQLQSLKFSGEIAEGLSMTAGHNLTAVQQFEADPASKSSANLFLFASDSLTPQYAFLGKGSGASFTQSLSETTSLSVGFLTTNDQSGDVGNEGFTTKADLNHAFAGGAKIGFSASFTNESDGFLGSDASGAFAGKNETNSQFFTLSGSLPLASSLDAFGSATMGISDLSDVNGSLLSGLDRTISDAFALGVVKSKLFDDKDKIGIMVSQPLRVEAGGSASLSVPTAVNADGTILRTTDQVSLTPSGRELNVQIAYSRALASNINLSNYALARSEPGHDADAKPDFGIGTRLSINF